MKRQTINILSYILISLVFVNCFNKKDNHTKRKNPSQTINAIKTSEKHENYIKIPLHCKDTMLNNLTILNRDKKSELIRLKEIKKYLYNIKITDFYDYYNYYGNQDEIFIINKNKTQIASIANGARKQFVISYLNKNEILNDSLCLYKINKYIFDYENIDTIYYFQSKYIFFVTGKGIELGMDLQSFLDIYKTCKYMEIKTKKDTTYVAMDMSVYFFKKKYPNINDMHFSRYVFVNNKLKIMRFGYHVP